MQVETLGGRSSASATASSWSRSASVSRALPIPGLAEHALGFKDLADAIQLRNHVLQRLDAADAAANDTQRASAS